MSNEHISENLNTEVRQLENRIHHLERLAHAAHGDEKLEIMNRIDSLKKREELVHYRRHVVEYAGDGFWREVRSNLGQFFKGFGRLRHH